MSINLRVIIILVVVGALSYFTYPPAEKIKLGLDLRGGAHIETQIDMVQLETKLGKKLSQFDMSTHLDQAIVVIRERINQRGLVEAEVRKGGKDRIVIQIPGYADKKEAEKLLTQVGYLEFAFVSEDQSKVSLAQKGKKIPGYRLLDMQSGRAGETISEAMLVKEAPEFDGTYLTSSSVSFSQDFSEPQVSISFSSKGAKLFANVTRKNIGRRLAIILDGKIMSAPVIQTEIPNGSAVITGKFDLEEAKQLSLILNAGALPARIVILESRIVSASLGKDSIAKGTKAFIFGMVFVSAFMVFYYLKGGVIAIIALGFNVVCILGSIAYIQDATLTLPGIAGLILTMGMAVDANVLIHERIREELSKGKRLKTAIEAGYDRVFWTVFDSNLTTFITSLILYNMGTGPVQGFALILMIGIVSSIFTGVFITRTMYMILLRFTNMNEMKMLSMVPHTNVNFVGSRKKAYIFSFLLIAVSLVGFFMKGDKKWGVDFSGGVILGVNFQENVKIEDVRSCLKNVPDVAIQYFGSDKDIIVKAKTGQGEAIKDSLAKGNFPKYEVVREEDVGPLVGSELKRSSLIALLLSFVAMIIYIGFRFEFSYGVGAIVALVHDTIISAGIFCLMGYEFNVPIIAALLTVVGYSINDTIVIFDRIREYLGSNSRKSQIELINEAINSTLSRTTLTSFATILVVIALMVYGGGIIHDFAFVLFIGIIIGTYSSIFVASPIIVEMTRKNDK